MLKSLFGRELAPIGSTPVGSSFLNPSLDVTCDVPSRWSGVRREPRFCGKFRDVRLVLVRDPSVGWRDEALLSTDPAMGDWEIVTGYCQRWSVEVAFADAKGLLGFHDPCVWKKESVERAAPMAWFTGALVLLWHARHGGDHPPARRQAITNDDLPHSEGPEIIPTRKVLVGSVFSVHVFQKRKHFVNPSRSRGPQGNSKKKSMSDRPRMSIPVITGLILLEGRDLPCFQGF